MFRPRIIPVLLLKNQGLVKSIRFKDYKYIGDPINAVRIFNELKADELVFLDIEATKENRSVSLELVKDIGEEANMPFAVGGGINNIQKIQDIIKAGAEKVVINSYAIDHPEFIKEASDTFGSSTIVVCIDVKKNLFGKQQVFLNNTKVKSKDTPVEFAKLMEKNGAGEIIIQSVDKDGTMKGYDLSLIESISEAVTIPVVALGGAGNINHLKEAYNKAKATALAAGSFFVYVGDKRGVLINYPDRNVINSFK
jgi:cyclase